MSHSNYYRMLFNKKKNKQKKINDKKNNGKANSMGKTVKFNKRIGNKMTGRSDDKRPSFY